jgi:thiol-disulfide isomerase/thioredoxin
MIPRSSVKKVLSLLAYIALAVFIAYLVVNRYSTLLPVGTLAPVDEKFHILTGNRISFRKFSKKPLLINFWASFCPPCLEELPILNDVAEQYHDDITLLGLGIATDKDTIMALKQKYGLSYPLGLADDKVAEMWGARVLPTTYLIDAQGKVLWAKAGRVSKKELLDAILQALHP